MPRKSITLPTVEIETQEELRATVADIAANMIVARQSRANMEAELAAIRARYEADLIPLDQQIETATEQVATYATQHPDLFPKGVRSLDLVTALIGFRTGQPKVKLLKRWTPFAVLEALKAQKYLGLIRQVEEIDKERVIADSRNGTLSEADLRAVGLAVIQDERFYVEPKDLEAQPTQTITETR
jgi:phage host-nuclease inhibitor protein Gam